MRSFKSVILALTALLFVLLSACQAAAPQPEASSTASAATSPSADPTETPAEVKPTQGLLAAMATNAAATAQAVQSTAPAPAATAAAADELDRDNWWNKATFYEIFVRSFKDSDGDGIGDFQGIISQLDYLNDGDPETKSDLGITGIWLMPINPSPSYHGYDVIDYFRVNPEYGSMSDFEQLVEECHKRGIKVIIDFVMNHSSDENPWFQEALKGNPGFENWYSWSDTMPQEAGPWGQTAWHKASNGRYYYGVFTADMPDLNYQNPMVARMMERVTEHWLKEVGVDGFRVDAARYLFEDGISKQDTKETIAWFKTWRDFLKPINPQAFTVGEVWAEAFVQKRYTNPKGLDSLFAFDLAEDIKGGVYSPSASRIIKAYNEAIDVMPDYAFSTFLSNHDQERVSNLYKGDDGLSKQAAFIYLTGPGIPFVYYGEEIGMLGAKPDPDLRTPMQWSADANAGFTEGRPWRPANADYPDRNVSAMDADADSLLAWYRGLIALRNVHPALATADYFTFTSNCPTLYATLRSNEDETLLTVLNIGAKEQRDCRISIEQSHLNGQYQVQAIWGSSAIETLSFAEDGSLSEFLLAPSLQGGESFILQLLPSGDGK